MKQSRIFWITIVVLGITASFVVAKLAAQQSPGSPEKITWSQLAGKIHKTGGLRAAAITGLALKDVLAGPIVYTTDKARAVVLPRVPVGDNGSLMHVRLAAPSAIKDVQWTCIGGTCGWSHGCAPAVCNGHKEIEINGNEADWWAWTNDGNNSTYVFQVYY